jgi:hypothetical protein
MSRKLISFIVSIFFLALLTPKAAWAATCNFTYSPNPPSQDSNVEVTVTSTDLTDNTFRVHYDTPTASSLAGPRNIDFSSGTATFTLTKPTGKGWGPGAYKIYFIEQSRTGNPSSVADCQGTFNITNAPTSSCTTTIPTKPIETDSPVTLVVEGINPDSYDIYINNEVKYTQTINSGSQLNLGTFNIGSYTVEIKNRCGILGLSCLANPPRLQCSAVKFDVAPKGSGGGGGTVITPGAPVPVATPCLDPKKCVFGGGQSCPDKDNRGPAMKTAIGCVHTNPAEFAKDFMKFAIGISGGLAFLMMLLGAFQMLTSAGNPDSLHAGRERLTSAVIGLLFVIFAVLLMQIIGFDILKIPGFGK